MADKKYMGRIKGRLEGRTIVRVCRLSSEEMNGLFGLGFNTPALALHLDDGTRIIPMQDPEGNGTGALGMDRASDSSWDVAC